MDTREAVRNATALLHIHGLAQQGWTVKLDRAKARFGQCNYTTKTISLSRALTESTTRERVENTVLHEIAHALVGRKAGHGPVWQAAHRRIGGTGRRTGQATTEQREAVPYRWIGTCARGHEYKRHKLLKKVKDHGRCAYGCGLLSWVDTSLSVR
jgi:predicted SprT family Zn-dependent metalloprotease